MCERSPRRATWLGAAAVRTLALLAALTLVLPAAGQSPAVRAVRTQLDALLATAGPETQVGLAVVDVASGECWFAHAAQQPLKPASVMKLLVTAAALDRFGPGFCYHTDVYVHDGELWIVGSGDPALGDERIAGRHGRAALQVLDDWAAAVRDVGVTRLERIVLDDSIFERPGRHPDWPVDQQDRWYQAPVGGLNLNNNCLDAAVQVSGGNVTLLLQPNLPATFIANSLRVGKQNKPILRRRPDSDVFEFSGPVTQSAAFKPASVGRPSVFLGYALEATLGTRGIVVDGPVVRRTIPPATLARLTPLARHTTRMPDVLWRCNTFSQNLFAECLLKSLVAYGPDGRRSGEPGSWEAGAEQMRSQLTALGLDLETAVLRDGSGLSHQNRLTAEQLAQLLRLMARHRHAAMYAASLAEPGQPGSMQRRYDDPALRGRLRGKTGTLSGVRTLAGYVDRPDGARLAFAVLCNGPKVADMPLQVARILATAGLN